VVGLSSNNKSIPERSPLWHFLLLEIVISGDILYGMITYNPFYKEFIVEVSLDLFRPLFPIGIWSTTWCNIEVSVYSMSSLFVSDELYLFWFVSRSPLSFWICFWSCRNSFCYCNRSSFALVASSWAMIFSSPIVLPLSIVMEFDGYPYILISPRSLLIVEPGDCVPPGPSLLIGLVGNSVVICSNTHVVIVASSRFSWLCSRVSGGSCVSSYVTPLYGKLGLGVVINSV
jgi:hypothetical protein